jgi:protein-tyrosine phosphatase
MSKHVLFLCTGNICRSPLAEGILKHRLEQKRIGSVTVSSAGTYGLSGSSAAEHGVEVAAQHGIDISDHIARHVTREMLDGADFVVCATMDHVVEAGAVLPDSGGKYSLLSDFGPPKGRGRDIADPYGMPIEYYVAAYERIDECVDGLLRELLGQ